MLSNSFSLFALALLVAWQLATAITIIDDANTAAASAATPAASTHHSDGGDGDDGDGDDGDDGDGAGKCTCVEGKKVRFGNCRVKNSQQVWKKHFSVDVGLYGDCLPSVEENTRKCFRWRLGEDCGENRGLKCSLRHRSNLDHALKQHHHKAEANSSLPSVVIIRSPGSRRRTPSYYNRNFCIFNVSLDCPPGGEVELVPIAKHTTALSSSGRCRDYLSFHVASQRRPVMRLCGEEVGESDTYTVIRSSSFYAVLWSNDDEVDRGTFDIKARCKTATTTQSQEKAHN